MKLTHKDLVRETLTRIENMQNHYQAVSAALRLMQRDAGYSRGGEIHPGNLMSELVQKELHEWRNLFMWALTLEDDERDRIKAAAYERFLRDGMSVAQWFNDGVLPSKWLAADEEQFREMTRKAFAPKK